MTPKHGGNLRHALPRSELQNRTQIFSIAYIGVKMCNKMTYISLVPSVNPAWCAHLHFKIKIADMEQFWKISQTDYLW